MELSDWECFCFVDGRSTGELPGKGPYQQKKLEAAEWLQKETP